MSRWLELTSVMRRGGAVVAALSMAIGCAKSPSDSNTPADAKSANQLLNVSNDPTRELWKEMNAAFVADHQKKSGVAATIKQTHAGSSSQARAVIDGLGADVVTLAMETDTDAIRKAGLIESNWQERLPNRSIPYLSTIVFVVRKGNPKGIKDWPDLGQEGIEVITPNPKTSGNGKLSFLAAWGSVLLRGGSTEDATKLVTTIYKQTPVLDTAARAATTTFAQKQIGDVHLTWESEAHLEVDEAKGSLEIIYPPISIKAEPPVAWVDRNVQRKKSADLAKAYLEFTYTDEGQRIFAKHFYRPYKAEILAEFASQFPEIRLFGIEEIAKNWQDANDQFFSEGKVFDQIYSGDAGAPPLPTAKSAEKK
jgi:sulfate/thiosulfate transport system substrate-binding protein